MKTIWSISSFSLRWVRKENNARGWFTQSYFLWKSSNQLNHYRFFILFYAFYKHKAQQNRSWQPCESEWKKQTTRLVARFSEISKPHGRLWIEKNKKVNITRHSLLQLFKAFLCPLCQRWRQFIEGDNTRVLQCQLDSACVLVDCLDILVQLIITRNNKKIITKKKVNACLPIFWQHDIYIET